MRTTSELTKGGPSFKEEVKASDFPKFDGSQKTFGVWLSKGDHWYCYSKVRRWRESLGRVSTFNFEGLAATWWAGDGVKTKLSLLLPTLPVARRGYECVVENGVVSSTSETKE